MILNMMTLRITTLDILTFIRPSLIICKLGIMIINKVTLGQHNDIHMTFIRTTLGVIVVNKMTQHYGSFKMTPRVGQKDTQNDGIQLNDT
jgi:hypothetical protein